MTNFQVKFQTDTDGVIDSHVAFVKADSVSEAENKALQALAPEFPPVEKQIAAEGDKPASTQTIEVKISIVGVEQAPANTFLIA